MAIFKFKITKQLPLGTRDLVWETIENLRSALDQAAYACAVAGGAINPKNAYFPIADTEADLESGVIGRGRCKHVPADILALFRTFKPYKEGNVPVWVLNKLCNSSKHRVIIPAGGMAENSLGVESLHFPKGPGAIFSPRWDSEKSEMKVFTAPIGSAVKYDLRFSVYIAFGEVDAVSGQPVIPVLRGITGEVGRILTAIEGEAKRIGLF